MNIDANALRDRGVAIYSDFTAGQKMMVVLATIGLVVGGMTFMRWAATPTYTPLYTGLEAQDAADVTDQLDKLGVDYTLADGGSTIMVPRDDVYEARLDLSAEGLPRVGGDGWNLIDDQGLTTSEFRQRVDLQRAMEGELARTIADFDAVEAATVHLVMPEDDLFSADDVHPSASVLIDSGAGRTLTASQVQAIVHLVASSVEGMTTDYVSIADTTGRVLSAPGQEGVDLAAGDQRLGQKAAYEAAVARSIESLIEPITGVGRTRVVVSADLDFDQKESVTESFGEPDTAPIVSEDTTNETYVNADTLVGGVLGPDAVPVTDENGTGSEYTRADVNRTYAVDKVTEQVKAAPGGVERLSVAVLVDEAAGVDTTEIADLVTAGAGLLPARGDSIEVKAMAFGEVDLATATEGTASEESDDMVLTLARIGGVVFMVLIILLLAYRSARKSSLAKYPVAIPLPSAAEETAALLAEFDEELTSADRPAAELAAPEPSRHTVLQEQIGELIDRQPEDVAAVLRSWLADRRG